MPSKDPRTERCLQDVDGHGWLNALASPLLEKLREAIVHLDHNSVENVPGQVKVMTGSAPSTYGGFGPSTAYRGQLKWDRESRTLFMCFRFHDVPRDPAVVPADCMSSWLQGSLVEPRWLAGVAPHAKVHAKTCETLDSIKVGELDLHGGITELTGGLQPRRINAIGWCTGGQLSTLAALWAAVHYPEADVRCVTFGAQKAGNAEFANVFRWLVGLSYRLVYFRDPVPESKGKRSLIGGDELVHVHGEMFVDDVTCCPTKLTNEADVDYSDHSWAVYQGALHRRFMAELQRGQAFSVSHEKNTDGQQCTTLVPDADAGPVCDPPASTDDMHGSPAEDPVSAARRDWASAAEPGLTGLQEGRDAAAREQMEPLQDHREQPASPWAEHAVHARQTDASQDATPASSPTERQADEGAAQRDAMSDAADDPQAANARKLRSTVSLLAKTNSPTSRLGQMLMAGKVRQAALYAAAAYRDEASFQQITGIKNSRLIVDVAERNTHVHIGWQEDGTAVFAFRGTATMQDGLADVKVMRLDVHYLRELFPGARAHLGFLQQFVGVCKPDRPNADLAAVLQQLSGGQAPTRVICTGHSLGGALATLGSAWAALQWPQADVRCITFGSPRVGNKSFKKAFHSLVGTSLRLVHGRDPVPVLPPGVVYHHVQGAIHITVDGHVKLRSRPWHYKWRPSLQHHGMAKYNLSMWDQLPGGLSKGANGALSAFRGDGPEHGEDEDDEGLKLAQMQGLADNSCGSRIIFGCISVSDGRMQPSQKQRNSLRVTEQ